MEKSDRGLWGQLDNTNVRLERRDHLFGVEDDPIDAPEPGMPFDIFQTFPMRFATQATRDISVKKLKKS